VPIRTFLRVHALFFVNCAFFGVCAGFAIAYVIHDDYWRAALWIVMALIYVPLVWHSSQRAIAQCRKWREKEGA